MTDKINYQTLSFYDLHKKCENGDQKALREWYRRWDSNYPHMAESEIKNCQAKQRPAKKDNKHLNMKLYHD